MFLIPRGAKLLLPAAYLYRQRLSVSRLNMILFVNM